MSEHVSGPSDDILFEPMDNSYVERVQGPLDLNPQLISDLPDVARSRLSFTGPSKKLPQGLGLPIRRK